MKMLWYLLFLSLPLRLLIQLSIVSGLTGMGSFGQQDKSVQNPVPKVQLHSRTVREHTSIEFQQKTTLKIKQGSLAAYSESILPCYVRLHIFCLYGVHCLVRPDPANFCVTFLNSKVKLLKRCSSGSGLDKRWFSAGLFLQCSWQCSKYFCWLGSSAI